MQLECLQAGWWQCFVLSEAPVVAADGRALARAVRVAGRVEPIFVEHIADLAQTIADNARSGDVVLCMGAGSIGAVPSQVVEMLEKKELHAQAGAAL